MFFKKEKNCRSNAFETPVFIASYFLMKMPFLLILNLFSSCINTWQGPKAAKLEATRMTFLIKKNQLSFYDYMSIKKDKNRFSTKEK